MVLSSVRLLRHLVSSSSSSSFYTYSSPKEHNMHLKTDRQQRKGEQSYSKFKPLVVFGPIISNIYFTIERKFIYKKKKKKIILAQRYGQVMWKTTCKNFQPCSIKTSPACSVSDIYPSSDRPGLELTLKHYIILIVILSTNNHLKITKMY